MEILITFVVVGCLFFMVYMIATYLEHREINNHYDALVASSPENANMYNMVRHLELKNEEKAEEYLRDYLRVTMKKCLN